MAVIDDKVVAMSFESSKFISGVDKTIYAIEALKKALNFSGTGKGIQTLGIAAKQIDLGHIAKGVDAVSSKLGAFRLSAIAIFSQVAGHAISAGLHVAQAFTLNPAKTGFAEYSTQLNSVQTILANTEAAGTKLKDVNATLKELNDYSDKTIYNFGQMARNIGTFTAAGVDLKTATASIKGIANLAALSGSNSEQASTAMYQLSQAISAGRVSLMDWNSVVNAGMGGTVFQRALAQTAEAMGTLKDGAVKLKGPMKNVTIAGESFRNSLTAAPGKESWLTSDVLTTTLKTFTGDLKKAELAAMGFTDAQIKSIQQTAKTAQNAATQVKTIQQVFQVAKETAGSGWAQTFQVIFGTFTEAKTTFTNLSNTINGFIIASSNARNKVLGDWKALGGRVELLRGIKEAFRNLMLIVKPIGDAFRDIFPRKTGQDLYNLTVRFKEFAKTLKPSPQTIAQIRLSFQGVFAVLHIGVQIISGIVSAFKRMFGMAKDNRRGILDWTASIGQMLVRLDEWLEKGNRLTRFFESLGNLMGGVLKVLGSFASSIKGFFTGFDSGKMTGDMTDASGAISGLGKVMDKVLGIFERFVEAFSGGANIDLTPVVDSLTDAIAGLGPAIGEALSSLSFDPIMQAIRTGLLGVLVFSIKGFLGKGAFSDQLGKAVGQNINSLAGGLLQNVNATFRALTGNLVAMQTNIKAKTLKEIAIAVAILAAAVIALSFVDPKKLAASLGAMATAFGELIGAMALLVLATKSGGFLKLPLITASLIALAAAIDLLVFALIALSFLDWEALAKGLTGVAGLLALVVTAAIPLQKSSGALMRAGLALIPLAIGLRILASVVGTFADMNFEEMGRGFAGVAGGLGLIAAAAWAMPPGMILQGAGLILIAGALKLLATVVEDFSDMEWEKMGKGMAGLGAALAIIAAAMLLMPLSTGIIAVGLIGLVIALKGIQKLVASFAGMSPEELAKGLGGLAAALGILALALYAMSGTLVGSTALTLAATALALFIPSLVTLGHLSWGKIIKGLVVLAATLAILGVAGALVLPAIPGLIGLGIAMALIGVGMAGVGAGLFLIASAIGVLVTTVPMGLGIMIAAFNELMAAMPEMVKNFVVAIMEIIQAASIAIPAFIEGIIKIVEDIAGLLMKAAPTVALAFGALLQIIVLVITDYAPRFIQAGFALLKAFLQGIWNNIAGVVTAVAGIVTKFLSTLASKIGSIVTAGANLIAQFLRGIANNIGKVVTAAVNVIARFLAAVATNLPKLIAAGAVVIVRFLKGIADSLPSIIAAGVTIIIRLIQGLTNALPRIIPAAVAFITKFCAELGKQAQPLATAALQLIIDLLNGVSAAIDAKSGEFGAAGARLGLAIVKGIGKGMIGAAGEVMRQAAGVANGILSKFHVPFKINSPSKVMMDLGHSIMQGMSMGLDKHADEAYNSASEISNGVISKFTDTFQIQSPSKVMIEIGKAVGQGFAVGIRGSREEIKAAFADMDAKLLEEMSTSRETIASEQEKLNKLLKEKKPDLSEIKKVQDVIKQNEELLARSTAGHITLTKALKDEKWELMALADDYEKIGIKLKNAQDKLDAVIKERKDFRQSLIDQYYEGPQLSELLTEEIKDARGAIAQQQAKLNEELGKSKQDPEQIASAQAAVISAQEAFDKLIAGKVLNAEGTAVDQLATYTQALTNQVSAVGAYQATLQQLRKLGLNDTTYQKMLKEGPADQAFANQLLAGGKTAIASLNALDADLKRVSESLATAAADNMYKAGIKSKQGLVNGLKKDKTKLRLAMEDIALEMVTALKNALKIKSPSQVFAEIGEFTMKGMAQGISNSAKVVEDAIDEAAKAALTAMKLTMRGISNAVTEELNPNPVITPILDLTQVRSQAAEMAALTSVVPITAAASYGQASMISSEQTAVQEEKSDSAVKMGPTVRFEQNNYSPESLTEVEIYRQTRNQLSQLKAVLT